MNHLHRTPSDRFMEKVGPATASGCLPWIAGSSKGGYGLFWMGGQMRYAHRVAYEWQVGPIPDGLVIDHLCRNRSCVNPLHMEVVTIRENTVRGIAADVNRVRISSQTHCKWGHPLSGANIHITAEGRRRCRACARERSRRSYAKRRSVTCAS